MISKTRINAQKPCGRQLNAKVCGSENAIFLIPLSFLKQPGLVRVNGALYGKSLRAY